MSTLFVLVLVLALLVWLAAPGVRRRFAPHELEPPDAELLEAAEREVRDLGQGASPAEGWEGDDWGPGAPKG